MFNIGDYVIFVDGAGIHSLEVGRTYKVIDVSKNFKGDQTVAVSEDLMPLRSIFPICGLGFDFAEDEIYFFDDKGEESYICYYNYKRFVGDVKLLRKQKLLEINSK